MFFKRFLSANKRPDTGKHRSRWQQLPLLVGMPPMAYDIVAQSSTSLTIDIPIEQLFTGAQTMIDALGGIYMLIAGFGFGITILSVIVVAIRRGIRM